ncbi:MAG: HyaD/HybD family hydrogenase maturation endopeptidase [Deltaproteobacteria bacterium]|nr:HyaD/HybD family hydrogenase maturation endopeptidase [Deltaproteobacteria bacterium]
MRMEEKKILVLGVGNILLRDEGVGVRVVEKLQAEYDFSPNVELMDGGTLGLRLMEPISEADVLIVADAVKNGEPPGTVYRLPAEMLAKRVAFKNSLHQLNLVETLMLTEILGNSPGVAVVIGVEPADISPWGVELTDIVQERVSEMCARVLEEVEKAGGSYVPKGRPVV